MYRAPIALSLLTAAVLVGSAGAQVTMTEIATVDVDSSANPASPEFIGSNPAAVAWDGADVYIAGYNNSPNAGSTAIARYAAALSGNPTPQAAFGVIANTPSFRGYSGLDINGAVLSAAYDDGGQNPNGITAWDTTAIGGPTQSWARLGRGGSGVGFDAGWNGAGAGQGVGWTTFGSGRRALQDTTTGADIHDSTNGMVIFTSEGTFWRDMDYDDDTGDVWLREGNNVIHGVRNGDNSISTLNVPFNPTDADFIGQQNVAFIQTLKGDFVLFNDRAGSGGGQDFFQVMKAIRPDGTTLDIDWGAFVPAGLGAGAYDFSFDAASNTVAILDFANRKVHIFAADFFPYFGYGQGCAGTGNVVPTLTVSGDGLPGTQLTLSLSQGVGGGSALIFLGLAQAQLPVGGGCDLLVAPVLPAFIGPIPLNGAAGAAGAGSFSLFGVLPLNSSGASFTMQGFVIDPNVIVGFSNTNGIQLDVP